MAFNPSEELHLEMAAIRFRYGVMIINIVREEERDKGREEKGEVKNVPLEIHRRIARHIFFITRVRFGV